MTNEDDILKRTRELRAGRSGAAQTGAPVLDRVRALRAEKRSTLEQMLFSPEVQREDENYTPAPDVSSLGGFAKNYGRSILRGVPFSDEIEGALSAVGPGLAPGGESFREAYRRNQQEAEVGARAFREEHPVTGAVGELAGMAATTALTLGAAPALANAPVRGAALGGALYGAGDAEGGLAERGTGAAVGGALSAVGAKLFGLAPRVLRSLLKPKRAAAVGATVAGVRSLGDDRPGIVDTGLDAGRGAGLAAGAVVGGRRLAGAISSRMVRGLADDAFREAAEAGGVTAARAREVQRLAGPARASEVRAFDLDESLRGLARSTMAPFGSTARSEIPAVAAERASPRLARGRAVKDLEEALGVSSGRSSATLRGLQGLRKETADELYPAARALPDVPAEDYDTLLGSGAMAPYIRDAEQRWERMEVARAARSGATPEPFNRHSVAALDLIKKSIDDDIEVAKRAGRSNSVSELVGLKKALLEPLDTPGSASHRPMYGAARANFEEMSKPVDAVRAPLGRLKGTKSFTRSSVDEVRDVLTRTSAENRALYRLGAIDDLKANPRALASLGPDSPDWEKLRLLVGDDRVMGVLEGRRGVEGLFSEAAGQLTPPRGSRTQFGEMDILNASEWANIAREALRDVLPALTTGKAVASETGRLLQLSGDDLIRYLEAMEKRARDELARRGREELIGAGLGAGLVGFGGGRLGDGGREKR